MKNKLKTVVVVPLCGNGSRFYKNGYNIPKPLIVTKNGEPIIDRTLKTLKNIHYDYLIFVVMNTMTKNYLHGVYKNAYVVQPNKITNGGIHTVMLGLIKIDNEINNMKDFHLIVLDGDNFVYTNNIEFKSDLQLFGMKNDDNSTRWARVVVDNKNKVAKIVEKKSLQNSTPLLGLFAFESGKRFIEVAQEILLERKIIGGSDELYLSQIIEKFLEQGLDIRLQITDNYKNFGTPEDLLNNRNY